jgi:hypothetical protein
MTMRTNKVLALFVFIMCTVYMKISYDTIIS